MRDNGEYRKSSYSGAAGCVEIAPVAEGVNLRDSKAPNGKVLFFTNEEWTAFLHGVRDGEFDLEGQ